MMRKKRLTKSLLKKTLKVKQYVELAPGYSDLCIPIFVENYKDDPEYYKFLGQFDIWKDGK